MKKRLLILFAFSFCLLVSSKMQAIENLPISYVSGPWQTPSTDGFTATLGGADYSNSDGTIAATFSRAANFFQINFNGEPTILTFRARSGSSLPVFTFVVYESNDGTTWSEVKKITSLATEDGNDKMSAVSSNYQLFSCPLQSSSSFVKWVYEERASSGGTSMYLYDVNIYNTASSIAPQFVSLLLGASKTEITNGDEVSPTENTTSLYFKFDKTVLVKDPSQIKINNGSSDLAISPYYYSNAQNPADNPNNLYSCSMLDNEVRISGIKFIDGESYAITIPAGNITDIYGNPLQSGINMSFTVNSTTGIADVIVDKEINTVKYYTLAGNETVESTKGILMKKVIYTDGSVKVFKVVK